ncbi:hypothetical protein M2131_001544 [Polynucleobacter sphagniphilus]|nr:hypothetical protein [Polynucleobacter sphagniphilus]
MVSKYTEPKISNNKILYQGKRYLIFSVTKETPFDDYLDYSDVIIFDKLNNYVLGCSLRDQKRSNSYEFNGFWVSPVNDGEEFQCNDIKELLKLIYQRTRKFG